MPPGRSLREVERRESDLLLLIALGGLAAVGATLVAVVIVNVIDTGRMVSHRVVP